MKRLQPETTISLPRSAATEKKNKQSARRAPLKIPNNPWLRWGIYPLGLLPAFWAFWLAASNQLGANPVKEFEHIVGLWGLRFLILTLLVTPLRDLFRINFLPYRRALGLLSFYYIAMHLAIYIILDRGLNWPDIIKDITHKNYIIIGFAAFILLIPLALTSNQWSIRHLKSKWQSLHRLIYLIALAGCVHFLLSVKSWPPQPLIYSAIVTALILWRFIRKPYLAYKKTDRF